MSAARSMRFAICSVALIAFCLFLWPRPASADNFTYNGKTYAITVETGSPFLLSSDLMNTAWWNDATAAPALPAIVLDTLGTQSCGTGLLGSVSNPSDTCGPIFALTSNAQGSFFAYFRDLNTGTTTSYLGTFTDDFPGYLFAVGSIVATPEPGTFSLTFVGLLGLGLLAGVKRYRGSRLQTQE